ncbi:MAG TPA: cytochrome c3 family protein [Gemmatimonadaceae bacterium]|nr:cytochrome c3 family protein [Gemmatimonadaceae bacterium]
MRLARLLSALALVGAALALTPPTVAGQDAIKDTKHNFSGSRSTSFTNLGVADYGEVCVYCHTPHGGSTSAPLWNRAFGSGPYTMYTASNSASIDMTIGTTPGPVSLACLSCHDGTIGIDVITNVPNSSSATSTGKTLTDIFMGSGVTRGADTLKVLGTDLRNDHPIAVTFDKSKDAMFNDLATIKGEGIRFFGASADQVECASCHNPHNKTNVPFLRKSNAASGLCLTCHIK